MEIVLLIIGLGIGFFIGWLFTSRDSKVKQAILTERLESQKNELEELHKKMNLEFEKMANDIFSKKANDFNRLSTESLTHILQPLGNNLKDFKEKIDQVYDRESKQRYSLEERIKELVELNNRISEDANNLTRALKGDSKIQGNWG
jgi:DNA recombination protein RmuC